MTSDKIPNYEPELERLARVAMDFLYEQMINRGVITTMQYDFGIPAVIQALKAVQLPPGSERDEVLNQGIQQLKRLLQEG